MLLRSVRQRQRRRGATLVEAALVYPIVILLTLGLIIAGLGVFRYHQIAALAREGARWASVRGAEYAKDRATTAATQANVRTYLVDNKAVGLDTSSTALQVVVTPSTVGARGSTVNVTVTYSWVPEAFRVYIGNSISMASTSEMVVSY
jgi:Flp pilus assembly protein TadG